MSAQRQRHGRRIARLLAPAAARGGGFASAQVRVRARSGLHLRPDACVARGDPPYDGVLVRAPVLVVVLGPAAEVAPWLALGVEAVWSPQAGGALVHRASGGVETVRAGGRLTLPGWPGLELRVRDLVPPALAVGPPVPPPAGSGPPPAEPAAPGEVAVGAGGGPRPATGAAPPVGFGVATARPDAPARAGSAPATAEGIRGCPEV